MAHSKWHIITYRQFSKIGCFLPTQKALFFALDYLNTVEISYDKKKSQKCQKLLEILKITLNVLGFFSSTSRWMKFYPCVHVGCLQV